MAAGISVMSRKAFASVVPTAPRSLAFDNLHTGERLHAVYWAGGQYVPESLAEIDHLLRDFRTNETKAIAPNLLDLLCTITDRLGTNRPIQLISGYRSPATNARLHARSSGVAKHSLHMDGMAADIRIPGHNLTQLRDVALSLRAGGVGFYPHSDFVHVDVGHVRHWTGV
ncbi:MAG: YcbK family protein [Proteobacteria bacterium]|nr:YcbK family protein [Pseudomonadota bacterium]